MCLKKILLLLSVSIAIHLINQPLFLDVQNVSTVCYSEEGALSSLMHTGLYSSLSLRINSYKRNCWIHTRINTLIFTTYDIYVSKDL